MSDRLLKASEASQLLNIHLMTLYALKRRHEIPFIKIGSRQTRFSRSDLKKWISSKKEKCPSSSLKKEGISRE